MFDQPINGLNKIVIVNPRYILTAVTTFTAKSHANQTQQHIKNTVPVRNSSSLLIAVTLDVCLAIETQMPQLPRFGNFDTKSPGIWRVGLFSRQ